MLAEDIRRFTAADDRDAARRGGIAGREAPDQEELPVQGADRPCEQLVDRYRIASGPVRDVLVDYPRNGFAELAALCQSAPKVLVGELREDIKRLRMLEAE